MKASFFENWGHKTIILMNPESAPVFKSVEEIKALRVQTDALLQIVQSKGTHMEGPMNDETLMELYYMAWQEAEKSAILAKMWLGKMLEGLGNPFPKELADKANVQ
jgi:hypothetical protein